MAAAANCLMPMPQNHHMHVEDRRTGTKPRDRDLHVRAGGREESERSRERPGDLRVRVGECGRGATKSCGSACACA